MTLTGHREFREDPEGHHQEELRRHPGSGGPSQTPHLLSLRKVSSISSFKSAVLNLEYARNLSRHARFTKCID